MRRATRGGRVGYPQGDPRDPSTLKSLDHPFSVSERLGIDVLSPRVGQGQEGEVRRVPTTPTCSDRERSMYHLPDTVPDGNPDRSDPGVGGILPTQRKSGELLYH